MSRSRRAYYVTCDADRGIDWTNTDLLFFSRREAAARARRLQDGTDDSCGRFFVAPVVITMVGPVRKKDRA